MYQTITNFIRKTQTEIPTFLFRILPWFITLLLSLLFFKIRGVETFPDSARYIAWGLSLYQGHGYVEPDWTMVTYRGPVFPGLLALSFWLFGVSVKSAMGVVRLFFVLNVVIVYALGAKLFNRATGFIAALLVLSALEIHLNSSLLLLDPVMPFFVLLSFWLLYSAFEQKRLIYFFVAGLALGIAFLTKSTAGLFFPLPALLWLVVPVYRRPLKKSWWGPALFYGASLIVLLPWFIYLDNAGAETFREIRVGLFLILRPLLTSGGNSETAGSSQAALGADQGQLLNQLWNWLTLYYQRDFAKRMVLAPLLLLAWGYVIFKAIIKRRPAEIFLAGDLLLFMLLAPTLARTFTGTRQNYYLYLLSYLALAHLIWSMVNYLPYPKTFGVIAAAIAIAIQIWVGDQSLIQLFRGVEPSGFVPEMGVYAPSFGRSGWEVGGELGYQGYQDIGEWLYKNSTPEDPILVEPRLARYLYFHLNGRQPVHRITIINTRKPDRETDVDRLAPLMFLWSYGDRTDPSDPQAFLLAASEPQLLAQIREEKVKYVGIGVRHNFLSLYFMSHPDFVLIRQAGNGQVKLFQVRKQVSPIAASPYNTFQMHVGQGVPILLKNLAEERPGGDSGLVNQFSQAIPKTYTAYQQLYLQELLGLSPAEIAQIESGQYPVIESEKIYSLDDYVRLIQLDGAKAIEQGLALHQDKAEWSPNNPWPYITLGTLHMARAEMQTQVAEANQDYEQALAAYKKALTLTSDPETEINIYVNMGKLYLSRGDIENGVDYFQKAAGLDPSDGELSRQIEQLQTIVEAENRIDIEFGDRFRLLGYDLPATEMKAGHDFRLTLYWQCQQQLAETYAVLVQAQDEAGQIRAQWDYQLHKSTDTGFWCSPGQITVSEYNISVPGRAPTGLYTLIMDVYDLQTETQLPVLGGRGENLPRGHMLLGSIRIVN